MTTLEFLGYVQFWNSATVMQKLQNCLLWSEFQADMIFSFLIDLGTVCFFDFMFFGSIKKVDLVI
jgi:hypothetical protein